MKFVYPEFLWGLSLLIVPIIIHLFSFKRYKTLYFSSLQFIQQVEQKNRSTQKIKNLLVLICRLLMLLFLVLAFAQPYFPRSTKQQTGGSPILSLHVDNSFSMTMKGVEGTLLSEAVEAARDLIQKAPLNTKILLSTNALDGVESRVSTKVQALERLDQIKPSPMVRSYDEVIKWQKEQLKNAIQVEHFGQTQFVYLSDFQKHTNQFTLLESDSIGYYLPIRFVSQEQSNLSIDSVWFDSPLHKVGVANNLSIKASNYGEKELQNVAIKFESNGVKRDLFIDIPKNGSSTTTITFSPKETGIHTGTISIEDKHFFSDDDYYFTYQVASKSNILVINGTDANAHVGSIYSLDQFYDVQTIDATSFTKNALNEINLVVLNGLNEIPSGLNANLVEFVSNGGTLAIFPGKRLELQSFNSFLQKVNMPLISKEVTQTSRINKINYKDPFFKGVFDKEKEGLNLPGVTRFYLTNQNSNLGAMSIIELQNGKALLYRNTTKQHVYFFTSVLDDSHGSFISDILFTTVLLRIGELSLLNPPLDVKIGETANYPIYKVQDANLPIIIKGSNFEFIPPKRQNGNVHYLDLSGAGISMALTSGLFDLTNNNKNISKIAVNYTRKESKIGSWTNEEIEHALKNVQIQNIKTLKVDQGVSTINLNIDKPYPYWKIFVSFALLFLVVELLLLKLWKNNTKKR